MAPAGQSAQGWEPRASWENHCDDDGFARGSVATHAGRLTTPWFPRIEHARSVTERAPARCIWSWIYSRIYKIPASSMFANLRKCAHNLQIPKAKGWLTADTRDVEEATDRRSHPGPALGAAGDLGTATSQPLRTARAERGHSHSSGVDAGRPVSA